jgi:hypothetical protein
VLGQAPLVSQIFVYGDSKEDKLVAIVVPDEEVLAARGLKDIPVESSGSKNKSLSDVILEELTSVGKAADLKGFELVHAGIVCTEIVCICLYVMCSSLFIFVRLHYIHVYIHIYVLGVLLLISIVLSACTCICMCFCLYLHILYSARGACTLDP